MADLLMIVPSRGRPHNIAALHTAWSAATSGNADLLVAVDDDDPHLDSYHTVCETRGIELTVGPRLRLCGTLNAVAKQHADTYRCLGFMGDDHRPRTRGWDTRFTETMSAGAGIVYGNDLLQGDKMCTAVAMTSDIVATLGYMAPPSLVHLCLDLVWKDWGQAMGRITYLDDVVIEHLHPANGKARMDAGYEEANSAERASADAEAYYAYRDGGQFAADVAKLRALIDAGRSPLA